MPGANSRTGRSLITATITRGEAGAAETEVGAWAGWSWQQLGTSLFSGLGHDGPQQAFRLDGWADSGSAATDTANTALRARLKSLLAPIT